MKTILTIFIWLAAILNSTISFAQQVHFISDGIIVFEKSVNMHAVMRKNNSGYTQRYIDELSDKYKASQPQFRILKSSLSFSKGKTLYMPAQGPRANADISFLGYDPILLQSNIIYTDVSERKSIIQKKVLQETYLIKDVPPVIKWKLTDETREIAGYPCHRANGLIMDSIYVVAFYTDKIHISGGPESFTGLPGMILGIALPYENVTWFATSVTEQAPSNALNPPNKGKTTNNKDFHNTLETKLKDQGPRAAYLLKATLLF